MFPKTKKELSSRLKKINLSEFQLSWKNFYIVPLGTSICLADLSNKEVKQFLKKQLSLYLNWKKRTLLLFLKFNLFEKKKFLLPKDVDLIRFGCREKLINFKKKEILTLTRNLREIKAKKTKKNTLNYPKIISIQDTYYKEELIWPYENINDKDAFDAFKNLIKLYKKNQKFLFIGKLISIKNKRGFGYIRIDRELEKVKHKKILCSSIQGDFWKGNLLKKKGKVFFLDFDAFGSGLLVDDLFKYFLSSQIYIKKINLSLLKKMTLLLRDTFNMSKPDFFEQINLETRMWMMNKSKKTRKSTIDTKNAFLKISKHY